MVTCAVSRCKNTSGKVSKNKDGVTYHRFPKDKDRRRRWELALNRSENWTSTSSSTVCSDHFDSKYFYLTESGLRKLSDEAVPSINISAIQDTEPTVSQLFIADIKSTDSEEIVKLKFKIQRLEVLAENRKKRLHRVSQSKKRLRQKLARMKNIILHLVRVRKDCENSQKEDT